MPSVKVDVRRVGPLAKRTGAITSMDVYERQGIPAGRTREFRDALTRAGDKALPGIPMLAKEWGWWAR